jgi:hypothetical protein
MSHPPIPESEFSPPWHQYFVKMKDYIASYFTATDARLDALENLNTEEEAEDEDWPVGCVANLSFSSSTTLTAEEKIEVSGAVLTAPIYYSLINPNGAVYISESGPLVNVGMWRLLNPPSSTGTKSSQYLFNFKRIS